MEDPESPPQQLKAENEKLRQLVRELEQKVRTLEEDILNLKAQEEGP